MRAPLVIIVVDDPATEVTLKEGGAVIDDPKGNRRITLMSGGHELEVTVRDPGGETRFFTKSFVLSRGGREVVNIREELARVAESVRPLASGEPKETVPATRERQAATLMEEICHVILGHSPTRLMLAEETSKGVRFRNFDKNQEEVAYSVGAAVLIPYFSLKHAVMAGLSSDKIARRFVVSRDLVEYRIKVCRLWADYKERRAQAL